MKFFGQNPDSRTCVSYHEASVRKDELQKTDTVERLLEVIY